MQYKIQSEVKLRGGGEFQNHDFPESIFSNFSVRQKLPALAAGNKQIVLVTYITIKYMLRSLMTYML